MICAFSTMRVKGGVQFCEGALGGAEGGFLEKGTFLAWWTLL